MPFRNALLSVLMIAAVYPLIGAGASEQVLETSLDQCTSLARSIPDSARKLEALLNLGEARALAHVPDARACLEAALALSPERDAKLLAQVARGFAECGDVVASRRLFARALETAVETADVRKRIIDLGRIAVAQAQSGLPEAAETIHRACNSVELIRDDSQKGEAIGTLVWSLGRPLGQTGHVKAALGVFSEATRLTGGIKHQPTREASLEKILSGQAEYDLRQACATAKILFDLAGPDTRNRLVSVFSELASPANAQASRELLRLAERASEFAPVDVLKMDSLSVIATSEARIGDVKAALHTLSDMELMQSRMDPPAASTAAHIAVVLCSIAAADAKAGDKASSQENLDKAQALSSTLRGGPYSNRCLAALAEAEARCGRPDEAAIAASSISLATPYMTVTDITSKAEAFLTIAEVHLRTHDAKAVRRSCRSAYEAVRQPGVVRGGRTPREFDVSLAAPLLMIRAAVCLARVGDLEGAVRAASGSEVLPRGNQFEAEEWQLVMSRVADLLAGYGAYIQAQVFVKQMEDGASRQYLIARITEAQTASGDLRAAVRWAMSLPDALDESCGLLGASRALLVPACPDKALSPAERSRQDD